MPASDTVDGLAQMALARQSPVLDLVREDDGSIRWERHDHSNGQVMYLPRRPIVPTADAATYERIFGRL